MGSFFTDPPPTSEESPRLHDILDSTDIEELHEAFNQANQNKFDPKQLRDLLMKYKIYFTDKQFNSIFLKVGTFVPI